VRHETCLVCRLAGDPDVQPVILISEAIGVPMHHHHTVHCSACSEWWFDDVVMGGLGIPLPSRRDTELCSCKDGLPQYAQAAVMVPMEESECECTKAQVERYQLPVRVGSQGAAQAMTADDLGRILAFTAAPPAGASPQFIAGWNRRRRANATGQCECGARLQMPNRAERRAAAARGERILHAYMVHEPDCPAGDEVLARLYRAGMN
jgi:hypothetical protein